LDLHEPDASARNWPPSDLDDEPREPTRTNPRPRPSAVHSIRSIEFLACVLVNRREHRTSMTNEEIEIPDLRQAQSRSVHAAQSTFAVDDFAGESQP
jgi:hypothetical protein